MACSCKAKKNSVAVNPSPVKIENKPRFLSLPKQIKGENKQSIIQIVSYSSSNSLSQSVSYDFSSDTLPVELCYNCIRKHLSIAYTLLQEGRSDMFLPALGQMLCASLHLINTNPGLHNIIRNRVLQAMRGNKDHILYDLLNWIQNVQTFTDTAQLLEPHPLQSNLIDLMEAYGLLFIQVSYQQMNKNWATAYLLEGAMQKLQYDQDIGQFHNVRRIWKLIQSMQLYDQTYWDARKALKEQLQIQWKKYKTSLTPAT